MNLGAEHASGEHLLFLNDDTEVISNDWLENMLQYSQQPGIGAVGAKLLFPNKNIQHAGVILLRGDPGHPYYNHGYDHPGYYLSAQVTRNYLAVTGACLMTRTELFRNVGGFDTSFPLYYNVVDYCLRVHERGYRIVYTPYAELFHYESVSRDGPGTVKPEEIAFFHSRWKQKYPVDPYYNPNLPVDRLY
jgi:GT2 family glycosyltransferase